MKKWNLISIILLAACIGLWFAAPFLSINMMTLGDQPTAFELFGDELNYYFNMEETPNYWAAMLVMIAIVLSMICALTGLNGAARFFAFLGELPLGWGFLQMYMWTEGGPYLMDSIGFGFWGMAVLLLGVVLFGGKKKA